ncbi:MAG: efflux RND transporter periplasmic adaptor subunit [Candidatus Gribaldobacteria bacterium]|nr:efflux RND transporter periplasmic adaptor subunit [Candidatus Gribaldobacteria bacterium]
MKKSLIITIIVLVAIVGGSISFVLLRPKVSPYEFATVAKQNIIQEVSVTGKVKPAEAVDLAFEKSGKINKIYKEVGQPVSQGEAILSLDSSELQSQLNQAQAQLEIQQINLQTLQKGARSEEISVLQTRLSNAQKALVDTQNKATSDLANLYNNVTDILHSAYAQADDTINKQIDDLFTNANTDSPQLTFQTTSFQYEISSEQQRVTSGDALKEFKEILDNLNSNYADLDLALTKSEQKLAVVRDFLDTLTSALNSSSNLSAATLTAYKGYVNTSRTNINAAITAINAQKQSTASQKITNQQNITTAQNNIENAQRDLDLKKAAATPEQLQENEAQIKSAQANIQNLAIQIAKTTLRSPFDGIVSKQIVKIGQVITANLNVVSIISQANFQIEANVAEADIAKIQVGNQAKTTLDAYGSDVIFEAQVIKIEPAETVIEGVPTYKTTFSFTENSDKIKSGMTANIDVMAAQRENVLAVPYRAIVAKNNEKIVRVINGEKIEERKVILGLRGSDGFIEIISGLNEGEKIITFEKKK